MPTDNKGKRHQCMIDERILVIKLHVEGHSCQEIERKTWVSWTQAAKIVTDFDCNGTIDTPQNRGAPQKLDERTKSYLAPLAGTDPEATINEITADSQVNVSLRLVGKVLCGLRYHLRLARRKSRLDECMKKQRLVWCHEKKTCTKADWRRKVYTNECKVELGHEGGWWQLRGHTDKAYEGQSLETTFRTQRTTASFWSASTYGRHHSFIHVHKQTIDKKTTKKDQLDLNALHIVRRSWSHI